MKRDRVLKGLGIGAAVLLAIIGAIAGYAFGPTKTTYQPTATAQAAVLAPTSSKAALVDGNGNLNLSETTAIRNVNTPTPASGQGVQGDLLERIAKSNLPSTQFILAQESDSGSSSTDDPCAPEGEKIPAGCPDVGLHSEIHRDIHLPALVVAPLPYPNLPVPFNPPYLSIGEDSCTSATTSSGPTTVPFVVYSNRPIQFSIRYIPAGHPEQVQQLSFGTSDAVTSAFNQAMASATSIDQIPEVIQCLVLTGLSPDTEYQALVGGADTIQGSPFSVNLSFSSAGPETHPALQLSASDGGLMVASQLHLASTTVTIKAFVLPENLLGATPSCAAADQQSQGATDAATQIVELPIAQQGDFPASPAQNAAQNTSGFDRNLIVSFYAPEGANLLVCARTYPGGTSPSWARANPLFESFATALAPDRLVPKFTLTNIQVLTGAAVRYEFTVTNSVGGMTCYLNSWETNAENGHPTDPAPGFSVPWTFCDENFTRQDSSSMLAARSGTPDRVLWIRAVWADGSTRTSQFVFPVTDGDCVGTCVLPADSYYNVSLGSRTAGSAICSDPLPGISCTPPTRQESLGVAQIKVSWEQGRQTGLSQWVISQSTRTFIDTELSSTPQLDLDSHSWTFTDPTPDAFRVLPAVTGTLDVVIDRPVDYTLRFLDGEAPVAGHAVNGCDAGHSALISTGHVDGAGQIRMPNVCVGHSYYAELELTDSAGHQSTWSMLESTNRWLFGAGGYASAPYVDADVTFQLQQGGNSDRALYDLSLNLGLTTVAIDTNALRGCESQFLMIQEHGTVPVRLTSEGLQVQLSIRTFMVAQRGVSADCGLPIDYLDPILVDQLIPLDQLRPGADITIDLPLGYLKISTVIHHE
ncbi:MAG: hypothetical protein IT191_05220 [Microbacteriaceae bacterium]|nr:hypothetical protein [Microbacteriaceae bacterium]